MEQEVVEVEEQLMLEVNHTTDKGGNGGNGLGKSITGSCVTYAGGGGGGASPCTRNHWWIRWSRRWRKLEMVDLGAAGTVNTGGGGGGGEPLLMMQHQQLQEWW